MQRNDSLKQIVLCHKQYDMNNNNLQCAIKEKGKRVRLVQEKLSSFLQLSKTNVSRSFCS